MQTVEVDIRKLDRALKFAPKILKYELADGMDRISKGFLKRFRQQRLQGYPGVRGASGRGLFGTFRRAFLVSPSIEGMGMMIYTYSKIAKLHEQGGIVKDPKGGRLAVPLSARKQMFTSKGKLRGRYKNPKELKNVKALRLKGKTFLAKITKRTNAVLPLYILKKQVTIKPRLGFYNTWDNLTDYRINILNKSILKALRRI